MAVLTLDQILAAADESKLPRKRVYIPLLGGEIWVRGMSGTEKDEFEQDEYNIRQTAPKGQNMSGYRGRFLARVICDADGKLLADVPHMKALGNLPAAVADTLIEEAGKLSKLTRAEIEALAKNSEGGPSGSPTTESPTQKD